MGAPRIKDIGVIESQPAGVRLTVVKISTDQDGSTDMGAPHSRSGPTWSSPGGEYLKPFLLGKTTDRIEISGNPATTARTGRTVRC